MRLKRKSQLNRTAMEDRLKNRNHWLLWGIIGLFSLLLAWKIAVTPFEIDFSVMLAFLLALFSIGISMLFYTKVNQLLLEIRQFILDNRGIKNAGRQLANVEVDDEPALEDDQDVGVTNEKIEAEEKTLKLKEEERKELLERLIQRAGLDEHEKQTYISQLEKVDNDLFRVRSNLNNLRKKINHSFSELFILEKTKQIRDMVERLEPEFIMEASLGDLNARFQMVKEELPESSLDFLRENDYVDDVDNINRKGYRELLKTAKKMAD